MDSNENNSCFRSRRGGSEPQGQGGQSGKGPSMLEMLFGATGGGQGQQGGEQGQRPGAGGRGSAPINVDFSKAKNKYSKMKKKSKVALWLVIIIILAAAYWWFHPPINPQSPDFWMIICVLFLLPSFLIFRSMMEKHAEETGQETKRSYKMKQANGPSAFQGSGLFPKRKKIKLQKLTGKARKYQLLSFIPIVLFVILIAGAMTSVSFFPGNAEK
ncbi:MAG: hypothetical protein HUJ51_00360, partial [Eggerthellaceae bacterium]|nr:hypothetical protein [Eggerthellaceae bacterium]